MINQNTGLVIIAISLIVDCLFNYFLNRNILFKGLLRFNINTKIRIYLQLFTIFSLIIYIIIFFSEYKLSYFEFIPIVFAFTNYINKPIAIYLHGIRVDKTDKGLITWGQLVSYEIKDNWINQTTIVKFRYNIVKTEDYENKEIEFDNKYKYELSSLLNSMKQYFDGKQLSKIRYFYLSKKVIFGIFFIGSLVYLFMNI